MSIVAKPFMVGLPSEMFFSDSTSRTWVPERYAQDQETAALIAGAGHVYWWLVLLCAAAGQSAAFAML